VIPARALYIGMIVPMLPLEWLSLSRSPAIKYWTMLAHCLLRLV
jgi:hypothetical protein